MCAAINALVLGVAYIPTLGGLFAQKDPAASIVRIAAGLNLANETNENIGGATPSVALFDANGQRIGLKLGGNNRINEGNFADIKVSPLRKGNNIAPEYISVVAGGTDSLCVEYIALTPPSGEYWVFYGDNAKNCGAQWYHSHGEVKTSGQPYYPACFWITKPDSSGKKANPAFPEGVGIHITDFAPDDGKNEEYQNNLDTACKSDPRFKLYDTLKAIDCLPVFDPPLESNMNGSDKDLNALKTPGKVNCSPGPGQLGTAAQWMDLTGTIPNDVPLKRKRYSSENSSLRSSPTTERKREGFQCDFDGHLVISDIDAHSAKDLCMSNTSSGPGFVSTSEGLYCDMCTHELWPVCHDKVSAACFDLATQTMRLALGNQARDENSGRIVPEKTFPQDKVQHWK